MRQVVQPAGGGPVLVRDVPRPSIGATEVLVRTLVSAMSPGTERSVTKLAQSGLWAKARARPDLVRQVLAKARADGLASTARTVRARLDDDVPLGYSAAGIAVEVGEAVVGIAPGQRVATGGAGRANHAEFQAVPGLLCAAVPDHVDTTDAAFATVSSVALHALRLSDVGPGAKVGVIGLGLLGQLSVRLAQAAGCDAVGIDVHQFRVDLAREAGALGLVESGEGTTRAVVEWSRGRGVDAVLLTAASSSSDIAARAPALCRDGANVVVVGDVGLALDRRPYYDRELSLRFARSYGPGRYEPSYEDWAVDFPAGLVRWSEGRNLEAVLDLLSSGRLSVGDLVTHRYDVNDAPVAYEMVDKGGERSMGIVFDYPADGAPTPEPAVVIRPPSSGAGLGVGFIGAGAFARGVLHPAFVEAGFNRFVAVASASGLSARRLAERGGFEKAVSGADAVINDPTVDVVVIATPHDAHAPLVAKALEAGKHVFCEKPLALDLEELERIEAVRAAGGVLFVGFNRRYSEAVRLTRAHLSARTGPLVMNYRVSAGELPAGHWYHDRRQGGRLLGEVCHFVDTCAAIAGSDVVDASAMGSTHGELLLADDLVVTLRHRDGSLATISYASRGHASTEKERVEVMGGGHTAVITDYRGLLLDGKAVKSGVSGKGHGAQVAAFRRIVEGSSPPGDGGVSSTRAVLQAAARLGAGA